MKIDLRLLPIIFFPLIFQPSWGQTDSTQLRNQDSLVIKELGEIIISASRVEENILKSPVSIELLDERAIKTGTKASVFEMLENVKGLQILTPSLGFKVFNARGFANTTNVRFVQLVDGMDNQAPHIGSPIANMFMPSDLDIERVEIIPGVSAATYGLNALNGLVNILSKNPFEYQGFSFQQKIGINHLNNSTFNINPQAFSETNLRYAKVLNQKLAFKLNASFIRAYDWTANNIADLNPNANVSTNLGGANNPGKDAVNIYGDEAPNRRTLSLGGKSYVISRTGYAESQIADYSLQNIRGNMAFYFRPNKTSEWVYNYQIGDLDNVYQRTNRFRLQDYRLQQHSLSFQNSFLQVRTYLTIENTGKSFNIRSMAENIDRSYRSDNQWFANFSTGFNTAIQQSNSITQAMQAARNFADTGRPQPATARFDSLIKVLGDINNWDIGAALRVKSRMWHAEAQYQLDKHLFWDWAQSQKMTVMAGFDYRNYTVIPDGNYFINPEESDKNLNYGKLGGFLQVNKSFFQQKLKTTLTLRMDKIEYFSAKFNPRFTTVFSPTQKHHFRFSAQRGYRFPSLFEGFSNVNSGGVKRVGGFPVMSRGIFENSYLRSSIDAFQAAVLRDVNQNGIPRDQAILNNQNLLRKNTYTYIQPEEVTSLEIGYKNSLFKGKLNFDMDFYYNVYQNFIAQIEANIPKTSLPDSIAFYLNDRTKQDRYRLWTNSKSRVYNYGGTVGLNYIFYQNWQLTANATYAQLDRKDNNDGLEEAFNTPNWIYNIGVNNPNFHKNFGWGLTYRWQSAYLWQSALATGNVPAYQTIDVQIAYFIPQIKLNLKLGAANLLNHYYDSFYGSPQIGGFYYLSLTYQTF